jgi:hypothetical protein
LEFCQDTSSALGISVDQILDEYQNLKSVTADSRDVSRSSSSETGGPLAERIVTATLRDALVDAATGFLERKAAKFTEQGSAMPTLQ